GLDQLDHLIDVGECNGQTFEDVATFASLAQQVDGTAGDDFATMIDEGLQHLLQVEQPRLTVHQRHHVDAEHHLHLRLGVEVVDHHLTHFALAQFDHDAHALFVGLIAQLRDAFDLFFLDELGDTFDQARFVHLIRQLGDDDALLTGALVFFDRGARTHVEFAAARAIGLHDAGTTIDDAGGRKIGTRHVFHQLVDGDGGVGHHGDAGGDDLAHVVRRNVGGHAHGDTGGAVHQQVGHLGRQHHGNLFGAIVVVGEVDGFLVEVGHQIMRQTLHADLGVTHGRRSVAIHRTEVTLTIHQRITQRKILRHAHDGFVDGGIAVRMVFTDDVAHDTGGLLVGLVPVVAEFAHREQHASMYGLQTITHVRQSASDDYAHGVIEIGLPHFAFDGDGLDLIVVLSHACYI